MIQTTIVIVLVVYCVLHASWTLMPRSVRQVIARKLLSLSLPLPDLLSKGIQSAAVAHSGCACHGCEHGSNGSLSTSGQITAVKAQPVVFHHKHRR